MMSLPIDIAFRNKYYTYWKDNVRQEPTKRKVREARNHAVREAWFDLWSYWGSKLAKKTGRFRMAVKTMIESQLLKLSQDKLTIRFLSLSGPIYNIYHIFGPEGEAVTDQPYKNPTTPNTKPLNEYNFMDTFEDLIIKHMNREFSALGLKWKQFVKVL
jgi:hypothetical protein